jgi:hypothetical protein
MASGNQQSYGAAVGTGANLDVRSVGFRPREVKIVNADSDDELYWTDTMADGTAYKRLKAGGGAMIATGGITPLSDGFRLGADTDINVDGETFHFMAAQ